MPSLFPNPTRVLFFTGKGGVGKTSIACATAIALAEQGKKVLLVSTDPASNLDEVLGVALDGAPRLVPGVENLSALNIDPEAAARRYRERVVGPYRGVLPESAIVSMEEQLSGACTVEIAAFDEFSKLLGDASATRDLDHVIFDTAPTGHTLRLLELPAAWSQFFDENVGGTSCLGPLSGLTAQRELYAASHAALRSAASTTVVLVARPDRASLKEAERTRSELSALGISNLRLTINGVFRAENAADPIARALEQRGHAALAELPPGLAALPRTEVALVPFGLVGVDALRSLGQGGRAAPALGDMPRSDDVVTEAMDALVQRISAAGRGVVLTMGKGGVGKTTIAARIARDLARAGHSVLLTTTDPAAHVADAAGGPLPNLEIARIDPELETRRYSEEVMATVGRDMDDRGRALLAEDLRSPCTEEIAVFRAFAECVAGGRDRFVVIDTAPTGHTLLLLDAAEAYHREVLKKASGSPDAVRELLPRLRDPSFTHVILVTLAEATPVHEALQLERDLARADIPVEAWVVNQSLTPLGVSDPVLRSRRSEELPFLRQLTEHAPHTIVEAWHAS